jgi:hypothetical protein
VLAVLTGLTLPAGSGGTAGADELLEMLCTLTAPDTGVMRSAVAYSLTALTNARLEAAGVGVIRVPGGELAGCRGGPRASCCPVGRDPAKQAA